ncbi:hypothetical protein [Candidatus Chloroploca sp. Khr17]|uniref:hypothetical protein n=1 Tax=Candidatus Chloroploca sp. Khr17 TaxID=2496869 RepID=UPI00101C65E0|nr:hypothetical protein [Candidatus Chloroploca sp. Khr17]
MRIILCETASQIRQIVAFQIAEPEISIVALTPDAAWACQRLGRTYIKPEDIYSDEELACNSSQIFTSSFEWIDEIDGSLQAHIPQFADAQFGPAQAWCLVLQSWLGEYYRGWHILQRLFKQYQPNHVLCWPYHEIEPRWNFVEDQSVLSLLLPQVASYCGVPFKILPEVSEHNSTISQNSTTRSLPYSRFALERFIRSYINPLIMAAQRQFGSSKWWAEVRHIYKTGLMNVPIPKITSAHKRMRLLTIGRGYDLDPTITILRREGIPIDWLDMYVPGTSHGPTCADPPLDAGLQTLLHQLWKSITPESMLWKLFKAWGLQPVQRAQQQFSHWWHEIIPQLWSGHQRAAVQLARKRYHAVIGMDAGGETLSGAMMQAAAAANVPRILYQHGSSSRIRTVGWQHFLVNTDLFFVYGSGTAQLIERDRLRHAETIAQISLIGSARLDFLRTGTSKLLISSLRALLHRNDPRPLILYIPTNFGGPARPFGEQTGYPDVSYFELQQRILRIFKGYPSVRLLYKDFSLANSSYNPVPDFIRAELPDVTIVHDLPLTRLMWAVDAIIVDHAITALGEVLLTKKPIVVYDPDPIEGLELPDARDLLRRRATVAITPDEFEAAVRTLLNRGDFTEVNQPDDSFLRAYCTHLNDGKSAERAAAEVMRIMRHS